MLFVDREGVVLNTETSSNVTLLSSSNATATSQENANNANTGTPSSILLTEEPLPSTSSDVVATNSALGSAVDAETTIPPISPTPSSHYDFRTSNFPSASTSREIGKNGSNDRPSNLPDLIRRCTYPSIVAIFILPSNTDAKVLFTLSEYDSAVCRNSVYGVRLAKWNSAATSGNTLDQTKLQWGGWQTEFIPETYDPQMYFMSVFTDVAPNEAYYAQVAVGREEDFIDGFTAPNASVISNVIFLGIQGTYFIDMTVMGLDVHKLDSLCAVA